MAKIDGLVQRTRVDGAAVSERTVLFTRPIQAPRFGARFSGKAGKHAIGTLLANDAVRRCQCRASRPLDILTESCIVHLYV
jgi:hypothetical protein